MKSVNSERKQKEMKTYIGVDLGGTNVRVAKVSENGEILSVVKEKTEINLGVEHVISKIVRMIQSLEGWESCNGVGLGVPGPVDTARGVMMLATNLPGFEQYPLSEEITKRTGLPAFVDNDVNVACLAESYHGAGKDSPICYYVTISTGIGGAFTVDHRLVSGMAGYAGEIADIIIDRNREKINYLNIGAVENEASGVAITRKGKAVFGDSIEHAGMVFDLARDKNPDALKIVDEMTTDLAIMFADIALVVNPHIFVVGGGCMQSKDVFFETVQEKFKNYVHEGMKCTKFTEAELEEPGLVGAAMLPMSHGE